MWIRSFSEKSLDFFMFSMILNKFKLNIIKEVKIIPDDSLNRSKITNTFIKTNIIVNVL